MRIVALIAWWLCSGALLAAAGDNSIIYLRPTDALTLDPWLATDFYSDETVANIFEGLVRFKKNSTAVEPCLASAWSVRDNGKRWVFTLRRGVVFHNGAAFNARAVLYSFNKRLDKSQGKYKQMESFFAAISHLRSRGAYTVEIVLKRPYAPFIQAMAFPVASIVHPDAENTGDYYPIGTGPFVFSGWIKGRSLILTRNSNYWGGRVRLGKIVYKVMPYSPGKILQVKNRAADMTVIQSAGEHGESLRSQDVALLSYPSISTHFLAFNTKKEPLDRLEIRAAFRHLFDKGQLIKKVFQNMAVPAFNPLPLPLVAADQVVPRNDRDLELARKLLKKAGHENGFTCTLHFASGQGGIQEIVDHLIVSAKKVGITLKKAKVPFPELVRIAERGEHQLLIIGWSSGPDPDLFIHPLFSTRADEKNFFQYENPRFFSLLEEGQLTMDPKAREKIYRDALAILDQDIPWIPLFHLNNIIVYNKKISGLFFNPHGYVMFRDAAKGVN